MALSAAETQVLRHRRERAEGRHGTREHVDPSARLARMPAEVDELTARVMALESKVNRLQRNLETITAERDNERMLRMELDERVGKLQRDAAVKPPVRRRG